MTQRQAEQAIIDGAMYWDSIGPNWYRLLDRDNNVLGLVRLEYFSVSWTASSHGRTATKNSVGDAKAWVYSQLNEVSL